MNKSFYYKVMRKLLCAITMLSNFGLLPFVAAQPSAIGNMLPLLQAWEKAEPNNGDMYYQYAAYYFNKARNKINATDTVFNYEPGFSENEELTTDNAKVKGYLAYGYYYKDSLVEIAFDYINKGLLRNKKRLDLYFAKIYCLLQTGQDEACINEISSTLRLVFDDGKNCLTKNDSAIRNPKTQCNEYLHGYCNTLFYLTPTPFTTIIAISEKILEYFPNESLSYFNVGFCYEAMARKGMYVDSGQKMENFKKAIIAYKQYLISQPNDLNIVFQLGEIYKEMGDNKNAHYCFGEVVNRADDNFEFQKSLKLKSIDNIKLLAHP